MALPTVGAQLLVFEKKFNTMLVRSSFIKRNPFLQDVGLEKGVSQAVHGKEIDFATQGILQLMEKTKEAFCRVLVRLGKLDNQVHVA